MKGRLLSAQQRVFAVAVLLPFSLRAFQLGGLRSADIPYGFFRGLLHLAAGDEGASLLVVLTRAGLASLALIRTRAAFVLFRHRFYVGHFAGHEILLFKAARVLLAEAQRRLASRVPDKDRAILVNRSHADATNDRRPGFPDEDQEENRDVTTLTRPSAKAGTAAAAHPKVEQPGKAFSDPSEVVSDPELSAGEKRVALDTLEQDARQLAVASAEGMDGGEETKLHNVLEAKRLLDLPSIDAAFAVVLRAFEEHGRDSLGTDLHVLVERAIEAITNAREAIADRAKSPAPPPGVPRAGSRRELEEELEKEKLDPGS